MGGACVRRGGVSAERGMKVPKWVEPCLEGWSRRLEECEGGPGGSLCRGTESVSEGAESALREGWRPNWAESALREG